MRRSKLPSQSFLFVPLQGWERRIRKQRGEGALEHGWYGKVTLLSTGAPCTAARPQIDFLGYLVQLGLPAGS